MPEQESSRWLMQAQWDLKASRDSAVAGNFEWACFQAQQAAGKALKSFLFEAGRSAGVLHSVRRLLLECGQVNPRFADLEAAA